MGEKFSQVGSFKSTASNIRLTFSWWMQSQTVCVQLAPVSMQFRGLSWENFDRQILAVGCWALKFAYNSERLHRINFFWTCSREPSSFSTETKSSMTGIIRLFSSSNFLTKFSISESKVLPFFKLGQVKIPFSATNFLAFPVWRSEAPNYLANVLRPQDFGARVKSNTFFESLADF